MAEVCGFVGLGDQGAPIARRMLDAGYPLLLWARRDEALKPFQSSAAKVMGSIGKLGTRADHVGVCVKGDDNAREVCEQLIAVMRPGSRLAVHSTTLPSTSRALAERATARRILLVDAPVSGGAQMAGAGRLTVMVGGDDAAVTSMRRVFETFASHIIHLGGIGTGQAAKLINNALLGAKLGLAHAAMTTGARLGIDRSALLDILRASSGNSFALDTYGRQTDLDTFVRRLSLLDQIKMLESVLGGRHQALSAIRAAATPLLGGDRRESCRTNFAERI